MRSVRSFDSGSEKHNYFVLPKSTVLCRERGATFGIVFVQMIKSEYQTLARRSQKAADVGPWALPWSVSSKKPRLVAQRYSRDTPILRHVSREAWWAFGIGNVDRTRQHDSNDRIRPADCHAAVLSALGHYQANIATSLLSCCRRRALGS